VFDISQLVPDEYLCLIYLNLGLMSTCVWYISTWAWWVPVFDISQLVPDVF